MGGATVAIVTPLYGGGFLLRSAAVGDGAGQDPALFGDGLTDSCPSLQSLPTGRIALQIKNQNQLSLFAYCFLLLEPTLQHTQQHK